jgi:hypothetical protein
MANRVPRRVLVLHHLCSLMMHRPQSRSHTGRVITKTVRLGVYKTRPWVYKTPFNSFGIYSKKMAWGIHSRSGTSWCIRYNPNTTDQSTRCLESTSDGPRSGSSNNCGCGTLFQGLTEPEGFILLRFSFSCCNLYLLVALRYQYCINNEYFFHGEDIPLLVLLHLLANDSLPLIFPEV